MASSDDWMFRFDRGSERWYDTRAGSHVSGMPVSYTKEQLEQFCQSEEAFRRWVEPRPEVR